MSSRRIAIGLSYFHVFELLQDYTPAFKGDRLERARTLRDLSRGYAFPYVSDLREGFGLSSNGIWIPRDSAELLDVEAIGQRVLQALKTSTAMNRKARRQLRDREVCGNALSGLFNASSLSQVNCRNLPLPKKFVELDCLGRYYRGDLSREEANLILREWVTDPVSLLEVWFDYSGRENPLTSSGHELASELRSDIARLRKAVGQVEASSAAIKTVRRKSYKEIDQSTREALREAAVAHDEALGRMSAPLWLFDNVPGFRALFPTEQAKLISMTLGTLVFDQRHVYDSDIVDLMHLLYLPLSDLWRGDKSFCNLLQKAKVPGCEKVVSRLLDLPERIEQLISARGEAA